MSQSEDYLDGLLNSINKAKTDAIQVEEKAIKKQQQATESRKAVAPDEDFFTATGINVEDVQTKTSHPYLRKVLSEEEFLRQFEEELESEDVDLFISNFEQEIDDEERIFQETGELPDSENVVDTLLDNINNVVQGATKALDEEEVPEPDPQDDIDLEVEPEVEEEPVSEEESEESSEEDISLELPGDDEIDLSSFIEESDEDELSSEEEASEESSEEDDDFGFSLDDVLEDVDEEPLDDSLKEFLPDDMDALDDAQFGEGEEPDLSGEGELDLENLLGGDDEDLLDIQSLLNGDEEGADLDAEIDESAEESGDDEETDSKGKKKKKKKDKKAKGEKKPNPILQKLALLFFGPPDEDDLEEEKKSGTTVEITYDEEGNPIIPEGAEEDPKAKKQRLKEEKKAAKEAAKKEKEAAKKEKAKEKKEKPAKPPKPKKEKKPKEPDNSPKIPISIIATFLVLSISIIGVVMVGMTFTGIKRHMAQANELFEEGNYIAAYEKLNGFDLHDEDVALLRNQARTLADLQLCQEQYEAFISYKQYNYALDSLIIGIGRYEKYKDNAQEYGISEQYEAYGSTIISELESEFGLSEEEALAIYKQPNRHYYTIELRKVLRGLGLPDL